MKNYNSDTDLFMKFDKEIMKYLREGYTNVEITLTLFYKYTNNFRYFVPTPDSIKEYLKSYHKDLVNPKGRGEKKVLFNDEYYQYMLYKKSLVTGCKYEYFLDKRYQEYRHYVMSTLNFEEYRNQIIKELYGFDSSKLQYPKKTINVQQNKSKKKNSKDINKIKNNKIGDLFNSENDMKKIYIVKEL